MQTKIIPLTVLLFWSSLSYSQVGVGIVVPNESAQMDIVSANKGMLIPRVSLQSLEDTETIENGNIESLLVYNKNSNSNIAAGYYYWFNMKWVKIINSTDLSDVNNTINRNFNISNDILNLTDSDDHVVSVALSAINLPDIITTLTKNENKTYTYKNENNVEVVLDPTQVIVTYLDGIYTFKDALGNVLTDIDTNSSHIRYSNASSGLIASNVQAAIDELQLLVSNSEVRINAVNGLTKTLDKIELGGNLDHPTILTTTDAKTFGIQGLGLGSLSDNIIVADPITGVLRQIKQVEEQISVPKYFYPPAVYLPTHSVGSNGESILLTSQQNINLYTDYYLPQFGWSGTATNRVKSPSATTLPVIQVNQLEYFVTWYDDAVFSNVTISDGGVLQYRIKDNAQVSSKTFMNIIFKLKD